MKLLGRIVTITSLLLLAACGGGGGNSGSTGGGTGSGSGSGSGGTGSGSGTAGQGSVVVQTYKGTALVKSFAASDLAVYAKATVKDESGKGVPDAIVSFSDSAGLLAFVPASKTALTNSDGVAEIDIKAAAADSLGATQLVAEATVKSSADGSDTSLKGTQNLSVTAATAQDPQAEATAINFKGAVPSDKSIVIAGSGGNGRSETALLTFVVVDSNGSPIKGVAVDFNVVPAGAVTLNTQTGTTNSSGEVTASVNSKSQPTAVTVNATVRGRSIYVGSDMLTVTTDVVTQRGFDLSASKFNMDADLSGDSSTLTVKIVDQNGNPVADGVPVVAMTDYGRVGTSSRGGCTTSNGGCSVPYEVQNPRPVDGVPVTVVFSTQTGQGTVVSDTLELWVTSVGWLNLYNPSGTPVATVNLAMADAAVCKFQGVSFLLGTPGGFAAPAETTVEVSSANGISTPTVTFGSPTLDRANTRTPLMLSVSGKSGSAGGNDQWIFKFTAKPSKTVSMLTLPVSVPACPAANP